MGVVDNGMDTFIQKYAFRINREVNETLAMARGGDTYLL